MDHDVWKTVFNWDGTITHNRKLPGTKNLPHPGVIHLVVWDVSDMGPEKLELS